MVQVDLITGFLGSGKTTFLRRYVQYLVAQGHSVCILENDFGAVNVDAMLLQDLIGEHCDIETISGGWVELNAARDAITVQPIPSGQEVLIVIGEGLDKAAIEAAVRGC